MNQLIHKKVSVPNTLKAICSSTKRALFVYTESSRSEDKLMADYFKNEKGFKVARVSTTKLRLKEIINCMYVSPNSDVQILNQLFMEYCED